MSWDYSELSRLAKQHGGPKELLAKQAAYHFKKGAVSKNPVIAAASLIGLGIGIGGTVFYSNWKNKKDRTIVTDSEIHKIEDELISGMEQTEQEEANQETFQEEVTQVEPLEKDNGNEDLGASI